MALYKYVYLLIVWNWWTVCYTAIYRHILPLTHVLAVFTSENILDLIVKSIFCKICRLSVEMLSSCRCSWRTVGVRQEVFAETLWK